MYLSRNIDSVLSSWSEAEERKPLVLRGARQTGKSCSVRQLAARFDLFVELNLERFEDLTLVRSCNSAEELLVALGARHNLTAFPRRTLLFLDEIQQSPEAIRWLRFFREDHPELFVVAAGSLMEVRLAERGFSFPVGRVSFRTLRPFTYLEFLRASDDDVLAETLEEASRTRRPVAAPLHARALALLRDYLLVGGMPEAVSRWVAHRNPVSVREVHADLVQALAEDLQKYRSPRDVAYLEATFANLKHHYGLRFKYESFAPGYRSQLMKTALGKLEAALLVTRVWPTNSLALPLVARPKSAPKLLPLDIGVALFCIGVAFDALRTLPLDRILDGRVAEMFVGLELLATRNAREETLHFWVRESSRRSAEVDYLLARPGIPIPVEVKSGASGSLKSLHQFLWRASSSEAVRLHPGAYADERHAVKMPDGDLRYRLLSVPLYLASQVRTLLARPTG